MRTDDNEAAGIELGGRWLRWAGAVSEAHSVLRYTADPDPLLAALNRQRTSADADAASAASFRGAGERSPLPSSRVATRVLGGAEP